MLPCKLLRTFSNNFTLTYLSEKYVLLIASGALLAVLVTVALLASRLFTKQPYERRIYRYSLVITNYAYLGYTLIEGVFGEAMLTDFTFFAIPFIIYTYTFGYALLTGGKGLLKRLVNPSTVAIALGMVLGLTGVQLPETVLGAISSASACVGPLSMLLTGLTLSAYRPRELLFDPRIYIFSAVRLILIPAAVLAVCRIFPLDAVMPMMLIITCMPCGLNTIVFPRLINADTRIGASLTLITHAIALPTLMLWLSILQ